MTLHRKELEHYRLGKALGTLEWIGNWFSDKDDIVPYCKNIEQFIMKSFSTESHDKQIKYVVSQLNNFFIRNRERVFAGRVAQEAEMEARRLRECITTHLRDEDDNLRPIVTGFNRLSDRLKENFDEAITDYIDGKYKSSVVMVRRTLQLALDEKRVPRGRNLAQQIENAKEAGIITDREVEAAHATRKLGNFGAHPSEDGLDDIDKNLTFTVLNTVSTILKKLYGQ
jgi:hypothetical protein